MVSKSTQLDLEVYNNLFRVAKVVKPRRENDPSVSEAIQSIIDIVEDNPLKKLELLMYDLKVHYREVYGNEGLDLLHNYLVLFYQNYENTNNRTSLFLTNMKQLTAKLKRKVSSPSKTKPAVKKRGCLVCQDKSPNPEGQFFQCQDCFDILCPGCGVKHLNLGPEHHTLQKFEVEA